MTIIPLKYYGDGRAAYALAGSMTCYGRRLKSLSQRLGRLSSSALFSCEMEFPSESTSVGYREKVHFRKSSALIHTEKIIYPEKDSWATN